MRRWFRTKKGSRTLEDVVMRAADDEYLPFSLREIRLKVAEQGGEDAQRMVDVTDAQLTRSVEKLVKADRLEEEAPRMTCQVDASCVKGGTLHKHGATLVEQDGRVHRKVRGDK